LAVKKGLRRSVAHRQGKQGIFVSHQFLCIHGHFYQPPRLDPFTNQIPHESGAAPYASFNEKITAECYWPNARQGNFERINFDLGPTLANWLEEAHPDLLTRIIDSDQQSVRRDGAGGAMAQAYNHTILPLASQRDKRTQILWGLWDFERRFGRAAEGMWLAETAVDLDTLALLRELGVRYTVLAPWQSVERVDTTEPYFVRLPGGGSINVFFYNGPLSGLVSFDSEATSDADRFAQQYLAPHLNQEKRARGEDQILLIASDGELYGHHKPFRDQFLSHLTREAAAHAGYQVTTLERYLRDHPPSREAWLRGPSSWSCQHGVARWSDGCACTIGDSSWKRPLRDAMDHLRQRLDALYERESASVLRDPWAARDAYLGLRSGWTDVATFWRTEGRRGRRPLLRSQEARVTKLLEAQYYGQWVYTSCGWFFEDLDRIEPRNDIAFARKAISLIWQATGVDLQTAFLRDLEATRSGVTGVTGVNLYRTLPHVKELPPLAEPAKGDKGAAESAA
jgi:alpha-amylase/alpha-mannosidase (GH57 family)